MATAKIGDMTVDDLKTLIMEVVDERLQHGRQQPRDARSVQEVLAAMDHLRWTPSPGSPTTTELLREDRDH